jgi:hypothetical protein
MVGWKDGRIGGWMDGWMGGWLDGWVGGWREGQMGRQVICIPYFLASREDNICIEENSPKCNTMTEYRKGVIIKVSHQYDTD